MTFFQAAALGLVQGLAEFLPISSSAHLILAPRLLGWPDQGLAFDVALHWGTLAALAAAFGREWLVLIRAGLARDGSESSRLFWRIALATLPAAVAGLALEDLAETAFRDPRRIAAALMAFGLLLGAADRIGGGGRSLDGLGLRGCLLIGCAQALALVPGVSRSGITITAGLFLGLARAEAARFSFLLSVPIVLGAGILKLDDVGLAAATGPFWVGIAVAGLSGYAAIKFLLAFVRSRGLAPFVIYRLALGVLLLALFR